MKSSRLWIRLPAALLFVSVWCSFVSATAIAENPPASPSHVSDDGQPDTDYTSCRSEALEDPKVQASGGQHSFLAGGLISRCAYERGNYLDVLRITKKTEPYMTAYRSTGFCMIRYYASMAYERMHDIPNAFRENQQIGSACTGQTIPTDWNENIIRIAEEGERAQLQGVQYDRPYTDFSSKAAVSDAATRITPTPDRLSSSPTAISQATPPSALERTLQQMANSREGAANKVAAKKAAAGKAAAHKVAAKKAVVDKKTADKAQTALIKGDGKVVVLADKTSLIDPTAMTNQCKADKVNQDDVATARDCAEAANEWAHLALDGNPALRGRFADGAAITLGLAAYGNASLDIRKAALQLQAAIFMEKKLPSDDFRMMNITHLQEQLYALEHPQ